MHLASMIIWRIPQTTHSTLNQEPRFIQHDDGTKECASAIIQEASLFPAMVL